MMEVDGGEEGTRKLHKEGAAARGDATRFAVELATFARRTAEAGGLYELFQQEADPGACVWCRNDGWTRHPTNKQTNKQTKTSTHDYDHDTLHRQRRWCT